MTLQMPVDVRRLNAKALAPSGPRILIPGSQVVPEEALRAHFARSVDELGVLLAVLGQSGRHRRYVLSIQPPLHDEAVIRDRSNSRRRMSPIRASLTAG